MIKTLRITSIIAATVLLVLPAVYGVRSDPKIEEFIKSPSAVDKFTAAKGQGPAKKNTESPLVKEAAGYSTIINPPPPPPPKVQPGAAPQAVAAPAPPAPVAAKFNLIATSYYASHPENSFVLIDEPGKGLHWVKQGSAVGHLTIETVKDGAIIVRDSQGTSEMTVKVQESWRKLLKNPPPETQPSSSSTEPASPTAQAPTGRPGPESPVTATKPGAASLPTRRSPRQGATPSAAERITPAVQPAPGQVARPGPAVGQPRSMEGGQAPPASEVSQLSPPEPEQTANPDATPPEATSDKQAEMDKLIADIAASKVTDDEAAKMEKLIEALKKMESEPSSEANAQPDANSGSPEPNTPSDTER